VPALGLLAVGRRPNTDDLGLEKAGVSVDADGYIVVDDELRTTSTGIWALGDCNGKGGFTHTAWNDANAQEYGFYSNVNPDVDHPRWSQATERRLGDFFKRKTLMFNGYGDQVASLYNGMDLKKNY